VAFQQSTVSYINALKLRLPGSKILKTNHKNANQSFIGSIDIWQCSRLGDPRICSKSVAGVRLSFLIGRKNKAGSGRPEPDWNKFRGASWQITSVRRECQKSAGTALFFPFVLASRVVLRHKYPVTQNKTGLTLFINKFLSRHNSVNFLGLRDYEICCCASRGFVRQCDRQKHDPCSIGIHGVGSCGSERDELPGTAAPVERKLSLPKRSIESLREELPVIRQSANKIGNCS